MQLGVGNEELGIGTDVADCRARRGCSCSQAVGLQGLVATAAHMPTRTPEVCGRMELSASLRREVGTGRRRRYERSLVIDGFYGA